MSMHSSTASFNYRGSLSLQGPNVAAGTPTVQVRQCVPPTAPRALYVSHSGLCGAEAIPNCDGAEIDAAFQTSMEKTGEHFHQLASLRFERSTNRRRKQDQTNIEPSRETVMSTLRSDSSTRKGFKLLAQLVEQFPAGRPVRFRAIARDPAAIAIGFSRHGSCLIPTKKTRQKTGPSGRSWSMISAAAAKCADRYVSPPPLFFRAQSGSGFTPYDFLVRRPRRNHGARDHPRQKAKRIRCLQSSAQDGQKGFFSFWK